MQGSLGEVGPLAVMGGELGEGFVPLVRANKNRWWSLELPPGFAKLFLGRGFTEALGCPGWEERLGVFLLISRGGALDGALYELRPLSLGGLLECGSYSVKPVPGCGKLS